MLAALVAGAISPADAHPHVWVSVKTTVLYENGAIVGFRQSWTFDEYYSVMAIEGLDKNGDGKYSREELAELAKINIEALKEFGYFTFPALKGEAVPVAAPTDYWLEHAPKAAAPAEASAKPESGPALVPSSGAARIAAQAGKPVHVLTLNFTLPLAKPVLAEAEGFSFSTADPSFFIAFDAAPAEPVLLSQGAPRGCRVAAEARAPDANPSRPGDLMASVPSDLAVNFVMAPVWQVSCSPNG